MKPYSPCNTATKWLERNEVAATCDKCGTIHDGDCPIFIDDDENVDWLHGKK